MSRKKWVIAVLLATTSAALSTTALANDRGVNIALGSVVGAVIGNSFHGRDGAIVGGVIGAAVGASATSAHAHGTVHSASHRHNPPRHYEQPVVRHRQVTYYRQAPVFYTPRPVYVKSYNGGRYDQHRHNAGRDAHRHSGERRGHDHRSDRGHGHSDYRR